MTKTNAQKYSEAIQAAEREIRETLSDKKICTRCGATGTTYINGSACTADLAAWCEGFENWNRERGQAMERQLAKVNLDKFGNPIK
ncbi:MAG: hypothetical protein AAFW60_00505 [Pseudomonadota bacterium]